VPDVDVQAPMRVGINPKINKAVSCCDTETRSIRKRHHTICN
jgi:hypothetical protein